MKKLLAIGLIVLGVILALLQLLPRIVPPICANCFQ